MARLPRVAIPDLPHHVTQRGNARQLVFAHDSDRATYLQLLRQYCELYDVALLGYCLMSNHVHLIAVPRTHTALADALRHTHGRYAAYWNARLASSGHVWQGRFYSCPWMSRIFGRPFAMSNGTRCAQAWSPTQCSGSGRVPPHIVQALPTLAWT